MVSTAEARGRRGRRILGRIAVAILLLLVLAFALWVFVLPGIVAGVLRAELAALGVESVDLEVRGLSWRGLQLGAVALEDPTRWSAASVHVAFDPGALAKGRVGRVEVAGARWEVRQQDGKVMLGPFDRPPDEAASGEPLDLPFDELEILGSRLVLVRVDGRWEIPISGTVTRRDPGALTFELEAHYAGEALLASGAIEIVEGKPKGRARLRLVPVSGTGALEASIDLEPRGDELAWRARLSGGRTQIDLPYALPGGARAEGLRVDLSLAGTGASRLEDVAGEISLALVEVGDTVIRDARIALAREGERVLARGTGRGDGWTLSRLAARVPADPRRWAEPGRLLELALSAVVDPPALAILGRRADLSAFPRGNVELQAQVTREAPGGDAAPAAWRIAVQRLAVTSPDGVLLDAGGIRATEVDLGLEALVLRRKGSLEIAIEPGPRVIVGVAGEAGHGAPPANGDRGVGHGSLVLDVPKGAKVWLPDEGGSESVVAQVQELEVTMAPWSAAFLGGRLAFQDLSFSGRAAIGVEKGRVQVWSLADARLEVARARIGQDDQAVELATVDLRAATTRDHPWLDVALRRGGGRTADLTHARFLLATTKPVLVESSRVRGEVAAVSIAVSSGQVPSPDPYAIDISLRAPRLVLAGEELAVQDLVLAAPLVYDAASPFPVAPPSGRAAAVACAGIDYRGAQVAGPELRVSRGGDGLRVEGGWNPTETATVELEGSIAPDLTGEVRIRTTEGRVTPEDALGTFLARVLKMEPTATFDLSGPIRFGPEGILPEVGLSIEDAKLASAEGKTTIEGIDGRIVIDSLAPLRSRPGQAFTFGKIAIGELELAEGSLRFTLEHADTLLLESAQCRVTGGGRMWLGAFRFDPSAPDLAISLFVEDLSLEEWLSLVSMDKATGSGSLNGHITVRIRLKPELRVTLGEGYLDAEGDGRIQVSEAEDVRQVLQQGMGSGGGGNVNYSELIQDRIVQSLQDFEYSTLQFELVPRDGGLTMQVRTRGKGRASGQELTLELNLNGFDDFVSLAIALKLGMEEAKSQLAERLGR